jgi:cytidylate kinase
MSMAENWSLHTVAKLRTTAQALIRAGVIKHKTARDVAFMSKEALVSMLIAAEVASDTDISKFTVEPTDTISEPVKAEPVKAEPVKAEPVVKSDLAATLADALKDYIKPELDADKVRAIVREMLETFDVTAKMAEVEKYMTDKAAVLESILTEKLMCLTPIKVETPKGEIKTLGIQHKSFELVLKLATARHNVWLVGPSGSGKTHLAESIAKALDVPFESISVGLQTSKTDLFGYTDAHGNYVQTSFYRRYREGGVFLLDEVDNGNANVLAMINAATSNGSCGFPCGMIEKHKDFVFMAAANTYGLGANAVYVGRNQIDGATRNRFAFVEIGYDETLESALTSNKSWLSTVRLIRRAVDTLKEKVIVSPRASILGSQALELGFTFDQCLEMYIFQGVNADVRDRVMSRAR